jgi:DNA repair photolyase
MRGRERQNPDRRLSPLTVVYEQADTEAALPADIVHYGEDDSRTILSRNDSPDLGFRWSVNPYRGCVHACAYCYARPTHEYLDLGAGTDFDTRIMVKRSAPGLLREAFDRPSWQGKLVMFSGVTDCYQPIEASLHLTRACLEVCRDYKNPAGIITKSALVERDVDLLTALAAVTNLRVSFSIPFRDEAHARAIEPWAPSPARRFKAMQALAEAGVPVGIMIAPVIPGLTDDAIVELLERARAAGATTAGYVLLRLPGVVKEVFQERLHQALPDRADKVIARLKKTRGGALYDPRFGMRGTGEGPYAAAIEQLFTTTARRLGFASRHHQDPPGTFSRPLRAGTQFRLF